MWKFLSAVLLAAPAMAQDIGRVALDAEIAAWDLDVAPGGVGLPPGQGSVDAGDGLYYAQCAACHGDFGEGVGRNPPLAGPAPIKSVGAFWPHVSTLFDYIQRAMPPQAPQSLSVADTYALTAYVLYLNDLVPGDFVLSEANFAQITLPNADGFYPDDRFATERPLFSGPPCRTECRDIPHITAGASDLNLTP